MISTYLNYQVYASNMTKSLQQIAAQPEVQRQQQYYQANIGKVKSVDDFINNYQLFSYAMQASGLSDMTYAKAFMKQVLTSDLSSPTSFVNKLTDPRFKAFAENFQFSTDGSVGDTPVAQTSSQEAQTVALYTQKAGSSSLDAVSSTLYYEQNIGKVKNMTDLMNDSQLYQYVMTAYGLDSSAISKGTLASTTASEQALAGVLESNTSDPNSLANQMADGQASTSALPSFAQSQSSQDALDTNYTAANGRTTDLIYYDNTIGSVKSVDAFLGDPTLVSVAEKNFGIDSSYSTSDLKAILTSDLSNPMSVANQLGPNAVAFAKAYNFSSSSSATNRFVEMAQDFNFDSSGNVTTPLTVQSSANVTATETLYTEQAGTDTAAKAKATADTSYFNSTIGSVTSLDQLLGNSRLVSYIESAYGISSSTSTDTLRQVLTSDLTNANSTANKMGASYRKLAAAFNFSTDGTIARDGSAVAESAKSALMMSDNFLQQTLQDNAGQQNQGVQLALYFQEKAPTITSAYTILADPALLKVVQTALGIPAASSSQDIDTQANEISSRLNLADLKDPAKLGKFISQFANLYDLDNSSSSDSNSILALFS